jgi:hypothetical protein
MPGGQRSVAAVDGDLGVIVSLASGTRWTVTGTSYLTSLALDATSAVAAAAERTITMTVGGTATAIGPGSYSGAIALTAG